MTITLHWWMLPFATMIVAVVLTSAAPSSSSWYDFGPLIWFFAALIFLVASLGIVVGHFL